MAFGANGQDGLLVRKHAVMMLCKFDRDLVPTLHHKMGEKIVSVKDMKCKDVIYLVVLWFRTALGVNGHSGLLVRSHVVIIHGKYATGFVTILNHITGEQIVKERHMKWMVVTNRLVSLIVLRNEWLQWISSMAIRTQNVTSYNQTMGVAYFIMLPLDNFVSSRIGNLTERCHSSPSPILKQVNRRTQWAKF